MTYDDWKLDSPEEESEHECPICDKPVDRPGPCSHDCFKADMR